MPWQSPSWVLTSRRKSAKTPSSGSANDVGATAPSPCIAIGGLGTSHAIGISALHSSFIRDARLTPCERVADAVRRGRPVGCVTRRGWSSGGRPQLHLKLAAEASEGSPGDIRLPQFQHRRPLAFDTADPGPHHGRSWCARTGAKTNCLAGPRLGFGAHALEPPSYTVTHGLSAGRRGRFPPLLFGASCGLPRRRRPQELDGTGSSSQSSFNSTRTTADAGWPVVSQQRIAEVDLTPSHAKLKRQGSGSRG
eukprot:scaffold259_cov252-Pinguiococcus_pyrenoidosus.AAC.5